MLQQPFVDLMNNFMQQQKTHGAAMMIFVIFFLIASLALVTALSYSIYSDLQVYRLAYDSKQSYLVADSAVEDMAYRFIAGIAPDATETIMINNVPATAHYVHDNIDDMYTIVAEAVDNRAHRSSEMTLFTGSGASFNFGVQSGNGGFELTNGSSVVGNVFSNGKVEKTGGGNATIYGDVISAGPTGIIKNVNITGSAWGHTIENSNVGGSVYAYTLDDGEVDGGAQYFTKIGGAVVHGSPEIGGIIVGDEEPATMPISDEAIDIMKQDIEDNGTIIAKTDPLCAGGKYFTDTNTTLGMVKIECDFEIKKKGSGTTLTLTGPVWVEGNILFTGGVNVVAHSSVGNRTVPVIADNELSRATSSKITVQVGTTFTGTGQAKSYILLLSQNNDAENGGAHNATAISLSQSSAGDLLVYAAHGSITLANSIALNEITGYKIRLGNSASVTYESGLVNLLFTSGPGGGYTIGSWKETQ